MEGKTSLTIDELYEQQVRARPLRERLRLAQRILAEAADATPEDRGGRRSLLELEGLGAELWGSVDAQAYVEQLRHEWDGGR
ncbi:MAG TPA: hypothetical protein VMW75_08770 [Thermoanaerobaculia bacterium]|nr:hypothetical protein [Thermoanaerobaculia bacterium]